MLQRGRHGMTCQTATEAMAKLRRVKSAQDSVEIPNSTGKEGCLRRSNFHISHHFSRSNDEMGWQHLCIEVIPSHVRKLFDSFGFCICTEACDVQLHYRLMFTSIFTWTQLFPHERVSAKMELQQSTRSNAWPHVWFLHGRIGVRRHSAEPVRFTLVFT